MKSKIFFKLLMLFVLVGLVACDKNSSNPTSNLKMKVVAMKEGITTNTESTTPAADNFDSIGTLDIMSYNAKKGEVVFKNSSEVLNKIAGSSLKINIYLKDKFLFTLIYTLPTMSNIVNQPVLDCMIEGKEYNDSNPRKWYILNGYPQGLVLDQAGLTTDAQDWEIIRKTNFEKIKNGWDLFVQQLKLEGKYIE